jgi:hypothetical protein
MVVGREGPPVVEAILDELWDDDTVVVVSTDLSHYLDDATAKDRDRRTAAAIVDVRPDDIGPYDACGAAPVRGLLGAVSERQMTVTLLDLTTSADTAGAPDRVVGYGAFAVA